MRLRNDPCVAAAFLLLTTCLLAAASAAGSFRFADATTTFRADADDETATAIPFGGIDDGGVSTDWPPPPAPFVATAGAAGESGAGRWVQRIQAASRSRSPQQPRAAAARTAVAALPFGRAIAGVLYGAPWPASRATPKCADDVRIYNEHARNFTLWAAKSE